jgi:RNA polymerase sigma-70 factor (ECF subfamily)
MMTLTVEDDTAFIELAQQGDRAAFGELVRRYQKRAYAVAYGLVGNREDALELAQESFAKAYRAMGRFDTAMPFYPWLYRILKNTCLNHINRRKRRGETSLDGLMDDGQDFATRHDGPEKLAHRTELRDRISESMLMLNDNHREILTLRHIEELSYAEIAEVLDVPKGTVMSRLHAARRGLREALERAG